MLSSPSETEKPRILVVEDNPVDLATLSSALRQEGYDFAVAANGLQAIDLYSSEFFPIIISNSVMPVMDGLELCRLIRSMKIQRYIYIILLTSLNSREDLIDGLEAGADEYMIKPIHQNELRLRLRGARRILGLEATLKQNLVEIRELSIRDALTGAFNRCYMDQHLTNEIMRTYRYSHPLSVIICDLDHFKAVNDSYGHQAGDLALKCCVSTIHSCIRHGIDWVARYGGEEFVIVLPETDLSGSQLVAERIRRRIASSPVAAFGCEFDITVSFGLVTIVPNSYNEKPPYVEQVLHVADTCLYRAKNEGRNRVVSTEFLHDQQGN